jgi:hypothetical protein
MLLVRITSDLLDLDLDLALDLGLDLDLDLALGLHPLVPRVAHRLDLPLIRLILLQISP